MRSGHVPMQNASGIVILHVDVTVFGMYDFMGTHITFIPSRKHSPGLKGGIHMTLQLTLGFLAGLA